MVANGRGSLGVRGAASVPVLGGIYNARSGLFVNGLLELLQRRHSNGSVQPASVVEPFDIGKQRLIGLFEIAIGDALDALGLEAAEKRLHLGVVVAIAFAAHAGNRLDFLQAHHETVAGVGGASVAVVQKPDDRMILGGSLQGACRELAVFDRRNLPSYDIAAMQIHGYGQVDPPLVGLDVGRVRNPNLMGELRKIHFPEQIAAVSILMFAMGLKRLEPTATSALEAATLHQSRDAELAVASPLQPKGQIDAGTSVDASIVAVDLLDNIGELGVLGASAGGFPRGPVVVSRTGHPQSLAHRRYAMSAGDHGDHLLTRPSSSPKMRIVFFRMSRCSVM